MKCCEYYDLLFLEKNKNVELKQKKKNLINDFKRRLRNKSTNWKQYKLQLTLEMFTTLISFFVGR